jgi:hypothetical protein
MWSSLFLKAASFAAFDVGGCDPTTQKESPLFALPHWWKYIHKGNYDGLGNCSPVVEFPQGIWAIALAVVDMLLYVAGIVAVFSIIIAGVSYMTSGGSSEKIVAARKRLINSIVGLVIVIIAIALVSFLGNYI